MRARLSPSSRSGARTSGRCRRRPTTPTSPRRFRARPWGFSRIARAVGILLLIAVLAAVIAGAVLLLTDAGQNTDIGELLKQEISDQIETLRDFLEENSP